MTKPQPSTKDSILAGAYTAAWTFVFLFGATVTTAAQEIIQWAQEWGSNGTPSEFPQMSVLASGAVSAVLSAGAGFVGTIVRLAQSKIRAIPGDPPRYE